MPRFDGTGPNGEGPLTGGGFGYCDYTDDERPVRRNIGLGLRRGYGRGYGLRGAYGRGFRRIYGVGRRCADFYSYQDRLDYSAEDERNILNNEKKALEARLKNINEYLEKSDSENEEK